MEPTPPKREDPEWVKRAVQAHIHYRVPGMDQVPTRPNLAYETRAGESRTFDFYEPVAARERNRAPCVILIHGGPIPSNLFTTPKEWGLFHSYGRLLGASGLAAMMFDHRFFAVDLIQQAIGDIQDLLAHLSQHADALNIDPSRLCLWAFSGGGVLLSPFLRECPAAIGCIVAYYAALASSTPAFSPAAQISANTGRIPPLLIARAGLDLPAYHEATDEFIQQALKKNACLDVLNHATGQHAFDVRDDNARTRDILRRTIQFIQSHLSNEEPNASRPAV